MTRRTLTASVIVAIACGALWYLRDPAWLIGQTTGLRGWERDADGTPYRWSGGHASFFVPSDARSIRLPVATTFDARGAEPMVVTFSVDDARAARLLLTSEGWHDVTLPLPPRGSRRVRRVDIRTSVTRDDSHGVKLGELTVGRAAGR